MCLWSQHRLKDRELAAFCAPEIDNALNSVGQPASEPYTCQRDQAEPALTSAHKLRWITAQDEQQLQTITSLCTLLDSIVEASCYTFAFNVYTHQSTCLCSHISVVYSANKARLMQSGHPPAGVGRLQRHRAGMLAPSGQTHASAQQRRPCMPGTQSASKLAQAGGGSW